jgi:hypothetical protein
MSQKKIIAIQVDFFLYIQSYLLLTEVSEWKIRMWSLTSFVFVQPFYCKINEPIGLPVLIEYENGEHLRRT